MSALDRMFPPGFRAAACLAALLVATGASQLCALAVRDEPYPMCAAALALALLGGGAVLLAFVRWNGSRGGPIEPSARRISASDVLLAVALAVVLGEAAWVFGETGIFFPLRMSLFWSGLVPVERLSESPLPMMLAGTCLVGLGALATAALSGAVWLFLYARGLHARSRAVGAALSFAGAVPYVAFALVVRAVVCGPVSLLAAGRFLAVRPDEHLAYGSLLGAAPGYLAACVALGLAVSRGMWSFLDQVRRAEERSDSFLLARMRGERPWEIVLRQGLWLRRRREVSALLLGGMAAAGLIDILSNTLIDSFRAPGFPPYPSLGAALFLRGLAPDGVPAPLARAWEVAHVATVAPALLLILAQTLPRRLGRVALEAGALSVGGNVLARGVDTPHGLAPRPSVQWVLGTSGSGKSTLLRAWTAQLDDSVLVPQDPDEALPASSSATDLLLLAARARPRGDAVVWDLLGRLGDERVRHRFFDPFTSVSPLSRGERQRLLLCLALARAHGDPACTVLLDEPTSAQDAARTHALLDCMRELLPARFDGTGSLAVSSHDPESIFALLGDRTRSAVTDHVVWLEDGSAHSFSLGDGQPAGFQSYLAAASTLLEYRGHQPNCGEFRLMSLNSAQRDGIRVLRPRVEIGGRDHAVSGRATIAGGDLVVLSGASGSGKTTLLRSITERRSSRIELGYLAQDLGRALPAEMPVRELLGPGVRLDMLRRWFGAGLDERLLSRTVAALSEGERQRLLLASEVLRLERAEGDRLRLLLLDEPFASLDPAAHLRLMGALLGWMTESNDRAAVLVSHRPLVDLGVARAFGIPAVEWTIGAEVV